MFTPTTKSGECVLFNELPNTWINAQVDCQKLNGSISDELSVAKSVFLKGTNKLNSAVVIYHP